MATRSYVREQLSALGTEGTTLQVGLMKALISSLGTQAVTPDAAHFSLAPTTTGHCIPSALMTMPAESSPCWNWPDVGATRHPSAPSGWWHSIRRNGECSAAMHWPRNSAQTDNL